MYTLSVSDGLKEAGNIAELMRQIDPVGTHQVENSIDQVRLMIKSQKPDIIWLSAGKKGILLAEECRKMRSKINFIFVGKTSALAIDAFRVHASGYIISPVTEEDVEKELCALRYPVCKERTGIEIQCFGRFEVYYMGNAIKFKRELSKELLACLVDRVGAGYSVNELCSVLWEDRPIDKNLKSQCRVFLSDLKKDLDAVGAGDILVKSGNKWSVDTTKVTCDYFDYLRGGSLCVNGYTGEYMSQYSWAETTNGRLYMREKKIPSKKL